ncbi:uncharacterized protein LOC123547228 [Mercenaria mercenaria]|uniref:uncharacterized protein LOC123547228 n=1 Tax=Mercenaria mercenaria TaxID=6596 RepID=UPI00234E7FBE|nr:uncharacterized protein LOC123547228 [Mercenaria mercenaria]
MDGEFIGPFCKELGLQLHTIADIKPLTNCHILNGVVLELYTQYRNISKVVDVLVRLNPELSTIHVNTLKSRINRIVEIKKKLVSKKKVKGVTSVDDLKRQIFENVPVKKKLYVTPCKNLNKSCENSSADLTDEIALLSPRGSEIDTIPVKQSNENVRDNVSPDNLNSPEPHNVETFNKNEKKSLNLFDYEIKKKANSLQRVVHEIESAKEHLKSLESRIGHYSVRNVNKRDETAKRNLHLLRETQRQLLRQKKLNDSDSETISQLNEKIETLNLKSGNEIEKHEQKKVNAQKSASYYKVRASKLREKLKNDNDEPLRALRTKLAEKDAKIRELEANYLILQDELREGKIETRTKDGAFTDNVRLCVVELSGLEVAVEKIPEVVRTVSKHLHGVDTCRSDLPSSTTVQAIVDEGHFLAKTFISQKLSETENWGLNRDGTTRRKQKILDTSVTLASGDILSLGFTRVAHETAETINNMTKDHVTELATLNQCLSTDESVEHFVKESLGKLAFTMSDRASNEKKADRLLDEWRDEVLSNCGETQQDKVLHFHCMAHVLLGFHRYICKDLKDHESKLTEQEALGRDGLSVFSCWRTKGTVVERVLLTTSDVFGPSGDHHGVRDLWEAYCAANAIKSIIGNYKDNRFNALFQTAAEIFLHRAHFIHVLETVKSPNLKLKSVIADLKDDRIFASIQCLGLFYLRVTGPYWALITNSDVPYLELHKEVSDMRDYLAVLETDPAAILQRNKIWKDIHVQYEKTLSSSLEELNEKNREAVFESVKLVANAMTKTIEKQLVDFIEDGAFSDTPSKEDLQRTFFAHSTNLGCEHHFGDLDSSQRRRPSASMHHHSSVQLLKRNRTNLMSWIADMPESEKEALLKSARSGGKKLREKHRRQEKNVLNEINEEMTKKCDKVKSKRKAKNDLNSKCGKTRKCNENSAENELLELLPSFDEINQNEYVAIAYQDRWYPGVVLTAQNEKKILVKFMAPTRKPGYFIWPGREDVQTVEHTFVLKAGFIPDCVNSGRMWFINDSHCIQKIFEKFKNVYF